MSDDGSFSIEEDVEDNNSEADGCIFYEETTINCVWYGENKFQRN